MTLAEDELATALSLAQRKTFTAFRSFYDAIEAEHALLVQRREQARLARVEVPSRVVPLPPAVVTREDLYPVFRSVYGRHPGGLQSEGVRLVGIGRDEYAWRDV